MRCPCRYDELVGMRHSAVSLTLRRLEGVTGGLTPDQRQLVAQYRPKADAVRHVEWHMVHLRCWAAAACQVLGQAGCCMRLLVCLRYQPCKVGACG